MTTWNRVKDILRVYIDLLIAIFVTVAGIVAIVTSNFGLTSDKVVPSLTLAVLFAISISILRDRISDRATAQSLRLVSESVRQRVFVRDDEPYEQLMKYIRGHRVRKVTLIQYSGNQSMGILTAALEQYNVNAELYLQHEDTAKDLGSERQADLIASSIRGKLSDLSGNIKERGSSLKVYRVTAPISLRAIKIDDEVLCMGWYTFEPEDRSGRPQYRGDRIAVSGHDRPTIIAWRGTADFEALVVTFDAMVKIYRDANNEVPL